MAPEYAANCMTGTSILIIMTIEFRLLTAFPAEHISEYASKYFVFTHHELVDMDGAQTYFLCAFSVLIRWLSLNAGVV